ncbi:MAG: serine O-acetyltransferase EpsC [Phycisphaerae bacterium]
MTHRLTGRVPEWTEKLLDSYHAGDPLNRIGDLALPSRTRIFEILDSLRRILFPGYFGRKMLTEQSVRYVVGDLLVQVAAELIEQITFCFCADRNCPECQTLDDCKDRAAEIAEAFLSRLPDVRAKLGLDAQAAYDGDPAARSIEEIVYCYPGFYAVTVHRLAHELFELGVPLMPRILSEHAHGMTGTDIHPGAKIGRRFFIDHATGVVIGETTEIGDNVKIYQGVTLGAKSFPKDERGRAIKGLKRHPTLEDNVTIYANATILGGQTVIGRGVTIAGNTFVTESVSAESLVTHEPPKLNVRSKRDRGSKPAD